VADNRNPAGRLHELLTRFAEQRALSTVQAWSVILEVAADEVPMHLGDVASLLRDVRNAARETGVDAFDPIPTHLTALSRSIFPVNEPFSGLAANVAPDSTAMQALKMLSAYLEQIAPEGTTPDEDELDQLRVDVRELITSVTAADLPPEIKRALLHRLGDVVEALEHVDVGGPDAVRRAAEALAISAVLYEADAEAHGTVLSRIKSLARKTWLAFTVTTSLAGAVLTWDRIAELHLLGSGQEQRQLPSPSSSPPSDAPGSNDEPR